MVEWPLGSWAPYLRWISIAASEMPANMSERQYHCSPAGYSASKALCNMVNGIGWRPTTSGEP